MPKPIMVSCDSACDLSDEMRERYAIQVTSMYIQQDGKVFRDGIDITPDDIYATYEAKGVLPTTSAIPPEEYREFFERFTAQGFAVLHIGLSSGISSTCQDAMIAASELDCLPLKPAGCGTRVWRFRRFMRRLWIWWIGPIPRLLWQSSRILPRADAAAR